MRYRVPLIVKGRAAELMPWCAYRIDDLVEHFGCTRAELLAATDACPLCFDLVHFGEGNFGDEHQTTDENATHVVGPEWFGCYLPRVLEEMPC